MGTNLQLAGLTADDFGGPALEGCNELLVVTRPEVVDRVHRSFLEVGVDVVETDTFGAFAPVLAEYGLADRVGRARTGRRPARPAGGRRFRHPDRPRWVAGSIGPGTKFPTLGQIRYAELRDAYQEQAAALLDGGVDLIIVETVFDLLQAKAAINGCQRAMVRPAARSRSRSRSRSSSPAGCCPAPRSAPPSPPSRPCDSTSSGSTAPPARPRWAKPSATCPARRACRLVPAQRRAAVSRRRGDALRPHPRAAGRATTTAS